MKRATLTALSALTRRSYTLARAVGLGGLRLRDLTSAHRPPVLVYQMGKVGSGSVVRAIRRRWDGPIAHLHTLRPERLEEEERVYRRTFSREREIPPYVLEGIHITRAMRRNKGRQWRVITLIRDPMARNLSNLFQSLNGHRFGTGFADRIRGGGDPQLVRDIREHFIANYNHRSALTWFDRELSVSMGIDVLGAAFSPQRGAHVYENRTARVLLLRFEDLVRCGSAEIGDFLGLSGLEIGHHNDSAQRFYSACYSAVRANLQAPDDLLDLLYESKLYRHFYTPAERAQFRERWGGKPANRVSA